MEPFELSRAEQEFVVTPKRGRFRVKRISTAKDIVLVSGAGLNSTTNVHSVFEADVSANNADEAIKIAMLFFPPAFGSVRGYEVRCQILGAENQIGSYPSSKLSESDIARLMVP